ncbi:MAG: hypothetical protein J6K39_03940 [Clostridia bacterium]|nr:hypothetical protein [Clostridia bacterium]
MENIYDDELMPDNFEQIARAYSKSLKKKGFVFVRLEEEEFNLLLSEISVLLEKMKACLKKLNKVLDCRELEERLKETNFLLQQQFEIKTTHPFKCVENENMAFLSLVSLENLLMLKLMLLAVKSGELELCNKIVTSIASVFANSFPVEGFRISTQRN